MQLRRVLAVITAASAAITMAAFLSALQCTLAACVVDDASIWATATFWPALLLALCTLVCLSLWCTRILRTFLGRNSAVLAVPTVVAIALAIAVHEPTIDGAIGWTLLYVFPHIFVPLCIATLAFEYLWPNSSFESRRAIEPGAAQLGR